MKINIGDRVKVVKWRDNGWSAEVMYKGEIVGQEEGVYLVRVVASSPRIEGWIVGEVEKEDPKDIVLL